MKILLEPRVLACAGLLSLLTGCASSYRPEPLEPRKILEQLNAVPEGAVPLSLAQAQALAVLRHPTLRKLRAERGMADAAEIRAELSPDPELSISPFWIVPQQVLGAVASLRWELLPPGSKEARRGLAGALRKSIDSQVAAAEWHLAQEARTVWLDLVRAQRAVDLAERARALSLEARDFGRAMLERGVARDVDVAVLDLDLSETERDLVAAKAAVKTARERLAQALGLPPGSAVEVSPDQDPFAPLDANVPAGNQDELLLQRLPELAEARSRYLLAEKELELAHLGALPKVSLGPDVQRDADSTFLGGGATISIPSTDANRAGIAEAKTRREVAARSFEEVLFEARAAVTKARAEEEAASQTLAFHESTVAPRAKETLDAAKRAVDAGVADLLTLLLARERALRAERTKLELRASRAVAVARLESAFGPEPPPEDSKSDEKLSVSIERGVR